MKDNPQPMKTVLQFTWPQGAVLKFIYSEKAIKFCKIFPLLLTALTVVKSEGKISQNFVAFSEYMNFRNHFKDLSYGGS